MADGDGSGGGVLDDLGDVAGNVGGAIWDEVKKMGSQATSQVGGSSSAPASSGSSKQPQNTPKPSADSGSNNPQSEFKKIGQSILGQITGQEPTPEAANLEKLSKADTDFSNREADIVRAKIKRMYDEYAAKKAQLDQREEAIEKQEEQQKQQVKEVKKEEQTNRAIEQTRAENKNYGAE